MNQNEPSMKAEMPDERTRSSTWTIGALALSMLLSSLGISIANVALPTLATAFAVPFQDVQWVVLAYLLAITVLIVSSGRLGDVVGHRRLLLVGISLFTVGSALCGMAPSFRILIAARTLQGLGAAILMALTIALVREAVPKEKTGSAMGLLGTTSAIGTALGPSIGGVLIAGYGWRSIFFIMVPLGILNLLLAYRFLPAGGPGTKIRWNEFDGPGTLLLGAALVAYALAMTGGAGRLNGSTAALLFGAVAAASLFIYVEARSPFPLIQLSTLRNPALSANLITNTLVSTVMMATLVVGPFYLSHALELGEASVGFVMSIGPVIATLSGVPAGRLVDRFGARSIIFLGLAEMIVGTTALAVLPPVYGVAGYLIAIAILTPGYQLFLAANNTAVMVDVPQDRRGVVSGMLSLSRNLGLITGASAMGALFALVAGGSRTTARPEAVTAGMQVTFAVAAVLTVLAITIVLASRFIANRSASSALASDRNSAS